jgi:hypothetical protein
MARFYASISTDAAKTEASRRGQKSIAAHVRGLDTGAREYRCAPGHDSEAVQDEHRARVWGALDALGAE